MQAFYNQIRALFKRKHTPIKQEVSALPADILAQISRESDFLREHHAVKVQTLPDGFEAKKPHAADPEVEAALPVMAQAEAASTS